MATAEETDRGRQASVAELVKQASEQSVALVRAEVRLAVAELKDKGRHAGRAGGLFGGAGAVAGYGVAVLLVAVVAALDLVLPLWAAALIVAVVLLAGAAALAVAGRRQLARAVPPAPEQAVETTRQDINEIKERARR